MTALTIPQITAELIGAGNDPAQSARAALQIAAHRRQIDADSIVRTVKAMPVTEQIEIVQRIVGSADFADFDMDETDRLDVALRALLSESREADFHEGRRLHGGLVAS